MNLNAWQKRAQFYFQNPKLDSLLPFYAETYYVYTMTTGVRRSMRYPMASMDAMRLQALTPSLKYFSPRPAVAA